MKKNVYQVAHNNEHAILQLLNQLYQSCNDKILPIDKFFDLSKVFNTIDHEIFTRKPVLVKSSYFDDTHDLFVYMFIKEMFRNN